MPLGRPRAATSSPRAAPPGASASPRWAAPKRRATSCGARCPGAPPTATRSSYVSLGEGATSEGEFWESLNTACRLGLPVLYVIADNGYTISVRATDQAPAPISTLVPGLHGLARHQARRPRLLRRAAQGRGGDPAGARRQGPGLIHATVTRPYSHSLSDDQSKYRTHGELVDEQEHDPLLVLEQELIRAGALTRKRRTRSATTRARRSRRPALDALAAPRPIRRRVTAHLYAPPRSPSSRPTRCRAIAGARRARAGDVRRGDPPHAARGNGPRRAHLVFGEDVADADPSALDAVPGKGGVFGITFGLQREFGQARCYNTPLAESNIVGRAVGQGIRGLRPSPEIQFFDYIWPAMQQLRSEAATIRWRSNGEFSARWCCGSRSVATSPAGRSGTRSVASRSSRTAPGCRSCSLLVRATPPACCGPHSGARPGPLPRAQAPLPPGPPPRPDAAARLDAAVRPRPLVTPGRGHRRHVGRHRPRRCSRRVRSIPRAAGRDHRPAHDRPVGPATRRRVGARTGPCSCCTRTRSPAASAPRSPRGSPTSASRNSTRPCYGSRARHACRLRAHPRSRGAAPSRRHHPRPPSPPRVLKAASLEARLGVWRSSW